MTEEKQIHVSPESSQSAIQANLLQMQAQINEQQRIASEQQKVISSVQAELSSVVTALRSIKDALRTVTENQQSGMRTNWGAVWSALGVVAIVAALVVIEPMFSLETRVEHHVEDGHPQAVKQEMARVEQIIHANETALESRLDRKQVQLQRIEERLDILSTDHTGMQERILDLEREAYTDARYRSGRPTYGAASNGNNED